MERDICRKEKFFFKFWRQIFAWEKNLKKKRISASTAVIKLVLFECEQRDEMKMRCLMTKKRIIEMILLV